METEKINRKIDELKNQIVHSTQKLIRIKSVREEPADQMPLGPGVAGALDYVLDLSRELGLSPFNLDNMIGWAQTGDSEEYVAVLTHLDVVPEGKGWTFPPYEARIHDNRIYGRGANDDKGALIASLYALKVLKDLGLEMKTRVRIIFGTAEESGGDGIIYYIEREKPPKLGFTPDGVFPIVNAEKGNIVFNLKSAFKKQNQAGDITVKAITGGENINMVPDFCEARLVAQNEEVVLLAVKEFSKKTGYKIFASLDQGEIVIESTGISGHSGSPEKGQNAIMQLVLFLNELPLESSDLTGIIKFLATRIGMQSNGENLGVGLADAISGMLVLNVGTINCDTRQIQIGINIRVPVEYKINDVLVPLTKTVTENGLEMAGLRFREPLYYPAEHPLIRVLQKVYTGQTGQEATLIAISGGTYAKAMPNIVAFGPGFPGRTYYAHKPDECIDIDELIKLTKIYAHAIYELANH